MHTKQGIGNQYLNLIEFAEQVRLELGDESSATTSAKIQNGHYNHLVEKKPGLTLPDASQWKVSLV